MKYLISITAALFAFPLVLAVYMLVATGHIAKKVKKLYYKLCGIQPDEWLRYWETVGMENSSGMESQNNTNLIDTSLKLQKKPA